LKAYVNAENIDKKTEGWLEKVAPFNRDGIKPVPEHTALLVIDMQNYFLEPGAPAFLNAAPAVVPRVRRLIETFRQKHRPVIFTRHEHSPDGCDAGIMQWWWSDMIIEGSPESEIHTDLSPLAHEKVIAKHRYSAFYNTDLEIILRGKEIEDLVICGVMTNLCCESTARDAYYRDFRVFFTADATAAKDEQMHIASLINLAYGFAVVISSDNVIKQMNAQLKAKTRNN